MALNVWQAVTKQRLEQLAGSDPEVRACLPAPTVGAAVRQPGLSLAEVVETVMTTYADRPAVGQRSGAAGFAMLTYRELWADARAVATAWSQSAEGPSAGELLCSLGSPSTGYATLELACIAHGVVSVPLTTTGSLAECTTLLSETQPAAIAVGVAQLEPTVEAILRADSVRPRSILLLDRDRDDADARSIIEAAEARLAAADHAPTIESLRAQADRGHSMPSAPLHTPRPDRETLAQIIYTSGATGSPKGAMFGTLHIAGLWIAQAQAQMPAIVTHYMPMSHTAGRMVLTGALARGGTCYFSTGSDPARMWDDVAATRPTEFFLIPRLCEMIRDRYRGIVRGLVASGRALEDAEAQARHQVRTTVLGGRVISAVNGSAPLDPELRALLEAILEAPVHDAYGSTEAGGVVLFNNHIQRPPVLEYKLSDVPELGYFGTDKPHPRGELLVKTMSMVPGYYHRPDLNAEMFDADGFYRTGDIMAQTGPDELVFVERRNNTLKLSQAEFVAVATLETVYASGPHIDQIFIYGRNGRPDLLAVVVPTAAASARFSDEELRTALADSLRDTAKQHDLRPYEIPRDFIVDPTPFSAANGLATGLSKPIRPRLTEYYAKTLEQLYVDLDEAQVTDLAQLRDGVADRPVIETVRQAAQALVGGSSALPADVAFTDLGGDSMSAYQLSSLLTELFDIEVPTTVIISPAHTLSHVADYIESERRAEHRRPTARTVHADPDRLRADDLRLEKLIDPALLAQASTWAVRSAKPGAILLTGANGYLGRFLVLELLRRLNGGPGKLICLVRGSDDIAARRRLDAAFDSGDAELVDVYQRLSYGRLEVLAGDVSQPRFGLSDADWARLSHEVDEIVHPAAAVNHVLPYEQLFGPNVLGTAELIRLALTDRIKPIVYLSTIGVADQIAPDRFDERTDIRSISPERSVVDQYANGYANTKWASEVLLREAHDRFGLPVTVFRSNLLLAHRSFRGQLNVPDMITRLILSVLLTGIAPASFYRPNPDGSRKRLHFDGLPVDFVAEAVATIRAEDRQYATYNLVNPNDDDGVSLDTFVDWLGEAGEPITLIDDYGAWVHRLEIGLRALPAALQQRTLLPLLHAFAEPEQLPTLTPSADDFRAAVRRHRIGGNGDIGSITPGLVAKYADDLRVRGLLEPLAPVEGTPEAPAQPAAA